MKKPLNEEVKRLQKLAGILSEIKIDTNPEYANQKDRVKEWLDDVLDGEEDPQLLSKIEKLLSKNHIMTKDLFRKIWKIYLLENSTGDMGSDWEAFGPTFKWIIDGDESHFDDF